jgi:hypothetical protein
VGWITVIVIVGSLSAAAFYLVRKGVRRWWEYIIVVVLTAVLVRPVLKTVTGNIARWLPSGIWSDTSDGKDQIIIASAASTILIPLVCVVRRVVEYSRENRIS